MKILNPNMLEELNQVSSVDTFGFVHSVGGLGIDVEGLDKVPIGSRVNIEMADGDPLHCEVIGFNRKLARCMPFGSSRGMTPGSKVRVAKGGNSLRPSRGWQGRIINGLGRPIDGLGELPLGDEKYSVHAPPPPATEREMVGERIDLGVKALNLFTPCCLGQRLGIFAASGVGKSMLLAMLSRHVQCDTIVVGLIGERGREVREFINNHLGSEGRKRSIVVVATSDEPALVRKQAAEVTLTVAEYLRDQGDKVLCVIDSITRYATAQREIGLAGREPPTTRGYPPSVFSEMPRLLERAGPGLIGKSGSITGLFTVLVDGDDHDEPIADTVRATLDGHIVLDRKIAERGRFPAVDPLRSVSRSAPACFTKSEEELWVKARQILSSYSDIEELVRIGAYRSGNNAEVDRAIELAPKIDALIAQGLEKTGDIASIFLELEQILN